MTLSAFADKAVMPNDTSVSKVLREKYSFWKDIKNYLIERCGDVLEEWNFPGKNYGWSFRMKFKKRTIIYLIPYTGHFNAAFVFGDKAVAVVEQSDLPRNIIDSLLNARKYMEGRGIQIDVNSSKDIENIKKLIEIKLAN